MKFIVYYYFDKENRKKCENFNQLVRKYKNKLTLDKIGIVQFIKFHYPLYKRTYIEEIKSGFQWENGEPLYFKYNENEKGYNKDKESILWEILKTSINNICNDKKKVYGVGNSGGLDSRIIIYLLKYFNINFKSYTFGEKKSDAVYIANKTAKILNFNNKIIEIEPDFLQKYWQLVIEKSTMFSILYSWYFSVYRDLPHMDVHITGFNGDNMLGSHLSEELIRISNKDELYKYIYFHYSYVANDLLKLVLNEKNLVKKVYLDYIENVSYSENKKNENVFEEFNFKCRQLKFIINSINFNYCQNIKWESPYISKDFMDFALNLTLDERFKRKLQYNMARKYLKKLNTLRFERNYFALGDQNKLKRRIKKIIWELDKKFNLRIYYKGSHKNIKEWINESNALKFIKQLFEKKSSLFDEIFNKQYIINNFYQIYQKNIHLLFNLLTVKVWIDTFLES